MARFLQLIQRQDRLASENDVFPIVAFMLLAIIMIVVLVVTVIGSLGAASTGPDPSEGDKHVG